MNARNLFRYCLVVMFTAALLLSACQPGVMVTTESPQPTATQAMAPSEAPTEMPTEAAGAAPGEVSLDTSGVAENAAVEVVPAQPATADSPYWQAAPEYRRITLQGYPVTDHRHQPQIFIYPVADLAQANKGMSKAAADLDTLLKTRQAGDKLPYLPLSGDIQAMYVQVQYLDFMGGSGVRYLTQLNNGMAPVNNSQLLYTFQGLTSDGMYYIAAVLPVTHPDLPAGPELVGDALADYPAYLTATTSMLDQQANGNFTPDLGMLDALIASIEVK